MKLLETLNTYTRIANDIKCDHKCELTPFLVKELRENPKGILPIYMFKFTNKEIVKDVLPFVKYAIGF